MIFNYKNTDLKPIGLYRNTGDLDANRIENGEDEVGSESESESKSSTGRDFEIVDRDELEETPTPPQWRQYINDA